MSLYLNTEKQEKQGGSWSLDNTILWSPNKDEIVGERYKTIVAAQAYIATQSPSANNLWTILAGGVNNENFSPLAYCRIVGLENLVLTGLIDGGTVGAESLKFVIKNCRLTNINLTGTNMLALIDCEVTGCNPSGGYLLLLIGKCFVSGGDFSALSILQGWYNIFSGTTIATLTANYQFVSFNNCNIQTGTCYRCNFVSCSFNLSAPLTLSSCDIDSNITIPSGITVTMKGGSAANITIDAGGVLNTDGVALALGTVTNNGTWNNKGNAYDNLASGLTSVEFQSAIDELDTRIDALGG